MSAAGLEGAPGSGPGPLPRENAEPGDHAFTVIGRVEGYPASVTWHARSSTSFLRYREGRVDDHHRLMLSLHLGHIDQLSATIERLDAEVSREISPFDEQVRLLCTIPGVGRRTAEVVIAEIGVDMGRFPTDKHLASWAGLCPGHHESAGKRRSGKARKGNGALQVALCEAAWSAARTRDTYLAAQFRRFSRRMGKKNEGKAIFAVAHTMIVIIWHVLATGAEYQEARRRLLRPAQHCRRDPAPRCRATAPRPRGHPHPGSLNHNRGKSGFARTGLPPRTPPRLQTLVAQGILVSER